MQDFQGIWVPLITPFTPDGEAIDHAGLRRLVRELAASGVAGFVACGSTGEAASLDDAEQLAVLRTVTEAAGGLPVIMGVAGVTPSSVIGRVARFAAEATPAAFLVAPPAYVKPSQAGIAAYFTAIADRSPRPLVLYDIPARTGARIETATMLKLAAHPNIRAVKDCSGDPGHAQAMVNDGRLCLLAGDDHRLFTTLCMGGVGAITASAHLRADLFVALHRQVRGNDLHAAARLWRSLWPLTKALFDEPNPGPVKAALARRLGLANQLRAPMTRMTAEGVARVMETLDALDAAWPLRAPG